MKRKKSNIEKHNDILVLLEHLGAPIYFIVGVIIVSALLVTGFSIKGAIARHNEQVANERQQEITTQRQEIVDKYINNNPKIFGAVTKQWNSGNLFFAESDKGEFTIAFKGLDVLKIVVENKAGQMVTLYERENP